jgi:hypothetical protein
MKYNKITRRINTCRYKIKYIKTLALGARSDIKDPLVKINPLRPKREGWLEIDIRFIFHAKRRLELLVHDVDIIIFRKIDNLRIVEYFAPVYRKIKFKNELAEDHRNWCSIFLKIIK